MSYYKYTAWGTVGLGIGAGAFSGYYIMNLETVFDHLKNYVLDPNANDSEWQNLNKNIQTLGKKYTDKIFAKVFKSNDENYSILRDWCRAQYKFTFKSLFESMDPLRIWEVKNVCAIAKTETSNQSSQ